MLENVANPTRVTNIIFRRFMLSSYWFLGSSFRRAIGFELLEIGPQVGNLLLVLEAGKGHLGARYLGRRSLNVVLERRLVPSDAGVLHAVRIIIGFERARLSAINCIEHRAQLVHVTLANGMAGQTHSKSLLARRDILSERSCG